jgi:hypothetical protein
MNLSVPKNTNYGPSPLYGLYPVDRTPADLTKYGSHTVKDVAKKSFKECVSITQSEIDFGKSVISTMIAPFGVLSDEEIVRGNDLLAGLNKDSSNGYKCDKLKTGYIDFDSGCLKPGFAIEIGEMERQLKEGFPDYEKLIWCETLKDEIRNEEKEGVPRSFRVGTIYNQVLTKKYFGKMVEHIITHKYNNGIMIGCNPVVDWPKIYDIMKDHPVFAGDIKNWDGNMLSQVQRAVAEVVVNMSSCPDIAGQLMETNVHSIVGVMDDLYLTTHSMPSGSFLTAIMNSMVNRFYTAIWYHRCLTHMKRKFTVNTFLYDVIDFVYGDDKLNGIRNHKDILNAQTMQKFFVDIGMDFTDALKKPIAAPFQTWDDITFLKRSFEYHNVLGKIVCPLELRTIKNSLSWMDYSKNMVEVMQGKVNAYQREIFLHHNREELLSDFIDRVREREYQIDILPFDYLIDLYGTGDYLPQYVSGGKYV